MTSVVPATHRQGLIARGAAFLKLPVRLGVACALLLSVAALAFAAADVPAEIKMAATHAGLAAKATTVTMVHTHLQHTLNCLVGPKGKGFDAKAVNPCAKIGDGAIPDATDASQKTALQAAVDKAESGLKETDLAAAQKVAADISSMLTAIK
jgi:hypothetical protein